MARTPLFGTLMKNLRLARLARRAGIPPDELLDRARQHRLRRRDLLRGAMALSSAAGLPACENDPRAIEQPSKDRVIVVGGGMAGLHAAYRLRNLGVAPKVHDAATRLGGRMFTDRTTFPGGMHCELGGELIDTGHETMHALAEELGIELLDYDDDDTELEHIVGWFGGRRLGEADILAEFGPLAEKIDEALATLTDPDGYITYEDPNGAEPLDALSISEWLDQAGASGSIKELLEVAYVCEYGLDAGDSSALNLLWLISTDTTEFQVFGDSDERFHAKDGSDTFIQKLVEGLPDSDLVVESRLVALSMRSDGVYRLTFEQGSSTREEFADHVVLALPFTLLRDVDIDVPLPEVKVRAIQELGYGKNSKVMCGFDGRPWRDAGSNGETFSDARYQSTWETSRLQPGAQGILTVFTGGTRAGEIGSKTAGENAAEAVAELEGPFPGIGAASNGIAVQFAWPDHPLTRGSYSAYRVGQFTTIAGSEIERVGNLHFCGEHTSLDAQGYMEGAALTGAMIADEVALDIDPMLLSYAAHRTAPAATTVRRLARAASFRDRRAFRAAVAEATIRRRRTRTV